MKKAIALFFCLQFFSGSTFAMELLKLPLLFEHYFEHEREEHPGLGFGAFLLEHYGDEEHADEKQGHCDEKLPFKHCHDCCTHASQVIVYMLPDQTNFSMVTVTEKIQRTEIAPGFSSGTLSSIWQPPRLG